MSEKKYVGSEALIRLVAQLKAGFASLTHTHTISDITDYTVDSSLSSTSTNPVQNKVVNSAISSNLNSAKAYTDSEVAKVTGGTVVVKEAEHADTADSATTATTATNANHAATADSATTATSATFATKATQDGNGNVISDTYETISNATSKYDEFAEDIKTLNEAIDLKADITDYNESIIGLSVNGTTVTYVKGDGSTHTFETQDTDTTYSLGTDEVTGLTKLYATTGSAEDGTMTQKAIKTELDKKVGVTIDESQDTLVFTI